MIVDMGFPKGAAAEAIRQANNDVGLALEVVFFWLCQNILLVAMFFHIFSVDLFCLSSHSFLHFHRLALCRIILMREASENVA